MGEDRAKQQKNIFDLFASHGMYAHAMDAGTHGAVHLPRRNVSSEERAAQECERKRCSTSMYHEKLQFIFFYFCPCALIISLFFSSFLLLLSSFSRQLCHSDAYAGAGIP